MQSKAVARCNDRLFVPQLNEIEFYRFYWPTIQQNLIKQLEERDLTLSMKSQRLWVSLGTQDLEFKEMQSLLKGSKAEFRRDSRLRVPTR